MSFLSWLRNLRRKSDRSRTVRRCQRQCQRRGSPRAATHRPSLETLEDRYVPASLSINSVSLLEGDSGTQNAMLTVTLTGSVSSPVSVDYSTANGTAYSGSDFQAVSGRLTFNKNTTTR